MKIAPLFPLLLALTACDNVGRLYDPDVGGGGTGPGTGIQAISVGGDVFDGRPRVDSVYPTGAGWPASVPIVVVFNESVNRESVAPGGTEDPTLFVRPVGSTNVLGAVYDFLLGDTVVVMRLTDPLANPSGTPEFEVVVTSGLTDADGVAFGGTETVVGTFVADEATGGSSLGNIEDGRILTVLPEDNARDVARETPYYAVFTKPTDPLTVTPASFLVEQGGSVIGGSRTFPLRVGTAEDTRVVRFEPSPGTIFAGNTDVTLTVDGTITFNAAEGVLDFGGASPFSEFRTLAFASAQDVTVGNATTGFPDKINTANLTNLMIDVDLDATAGVRDTVVVRIYGLDRETSTEDDLDFVERSAEVTVAGAQTISVDFSGALGTLTAPRFGDGDISLVAQLRRGSLRTGFIAPVVDNSPRHDLVPPTLTTAGPPAGDLAEDLLTDLEAVAFFGTASETVADATLTAGATTAPLFAAADDGTFTLEPLDLGLRTTPLAYTLSLTDSAGNVGTAAIAGRILPRGIVTGTVGSSLVVEVYDESTLAALAGATVVVQPDASTSAGRVTGVTGVTDASGRVTFTGLTQPAHTITVVATGYHLTTLLDTGAAHASLGVTPQTAATATFAGTAGFVGATGSTALIGHNLLADGSNEGIQTTTAAPLVIPTTPILPNRLQVVTAFAGVFEPSAAPSFTFAACQMCGNTGFAETAPLGPTDPGGSSSVGLTLLSGLTRETTQYSVDFAAAGGLGTLASTPTVRVVGNLVGMPGQTLFGAGFATLTSGAAYTVDSTFLLSAVTTLLDFTPALFVSVEGRDGSGNLSRHRAAIDVTSLAATPVLTPPGVPTIATPSGSFSGAPVVTYEDRLDPSLGTSLVGFLELTATDAAAREWRVIRQDNDGTASAEQVALPSLAGTGVTGLAAGTWTIRAESHLALSTTFGVDRFVWEEIRRRQVGYARAAAVNHTVN